jgi:hypothetical protein
MSISKGKIAVTRGILGRDDKCIINQGTLIKAFGALESDTIYFFLSKKAAYSELV